MSPSSAASNNIQTAITNITARIVEVTASANPDYSVGNRSVSKAAYLATLRAELAEMLKLAQDLGGPWELRTKGIAW